MSEMIPGAESRFGFPESFTELCASVKKEYEAHGAFFLEEAYLLDVDNRYGAFPRTLDAVLSAAAVLRADGAAAEYALFLVRAMEQRDRFKANIRCARFPEERHPMFAFLCLVPFIGKTREDLVRRGLPADIVAQTVNQYEDCLFVYEKRFGRLGINMRYFNHLQEYVDCEILNVDRLRFGFVPLRHPIYLLRRRSDGEYLLLMGEREITADGLCAKDASSGTAAAFTAFFEETTEYYRGTPVGEDGKCTPQISSYNKSEYELVLRKGDLCLATHIHPYGELSREACFASYRRALDLMKKHYPELDFKAFSCSSWMMSPELKDVMREGSKVLDFQSFYLRFPVPTQGKAVLNFVFYMPDAEDYTKLPEDTSLQRALKQRYLAGGRLNEYGGIMPFEVVADQK